jgi:aminopeptidase N
MASNESLLLEDDQPAFRAFVARKLRPAAKELGWTASKKDTPSRRSLRAAVLGGLTALARDPATIRQAKAKLAEFEKKPASLDLTLLPLILTSAARNGDAALWDRFHAKMDSASDLELRDRYRTALAEFGEPALIQKTLDLTLSGGIRKQDIPYQLAALLDNPLARDQTLKFLEAHWGELKDRFSGIAATWSILPALGEFCSAEVHDELQTFFADPAHHVDGGDRAMKLALERIDLCVTFKKNQAAELSRWVGAHASKR